MLWIWNIVNTNELGYMSWQRRTDKHGQIISIRLSDHGKQKLQKSGTRIQPNINTEILKEIQCPLLHTPSLPERKWHVRNITGINTHTHTNTDKTCHYIPLLFSRNFSNFSLTFIVICSYTMVIKKSYSKWKKMKKNNNKCLKIHISTSCIKSNI